MGFFLYHVKMAFLRQTDYDLTALVFTSVNFAPHSSVKLSFFTFSENAFS